MQTIEEIKQIISEIVQEVFLEPVESGRDFLFEKYISPGPFDMLEIVVALEGRFGIEIPEEDFGIITGIDTAAEYVMSRIEETKKWLTHE